MPRLSLWNKNKTNDYDFQDRIIAENINAGGTGVYVHKYIGTYTDDTTASTGTGDLYIQDVLFLENRDRKYDTDIYELRGSYTPGDPDFDLTQFGMFVNNDSLFMTFHMNTCASLLGRRLMAGDVVELPHLRDDLLLGGGEAVNRYFVVSDAGRPAEGYDARWWPHLWRVKLTNITDSPEYRDILGTGESADDLRNILSTYSTEIAISDKVQALAASETPYDADYVAGGHLYVEGDTPGVYLRTDFAPHRLFLKNLSVWRKVSDDKTAAWSAANKILTSFVNNDDQRINTDGTTDAVKTNLSKIVKPKAD